jgi:hypothetical protein
MPPSPSPSDLKRQLQRELLRLLLGVIAVHAVAIGVYYLLGFETRGRTARLLFTVAWVAATLAVVVPTIRRIKVLRARARRR